MNRASLIKKNKISIIIFCLVAVLYLITYLFNSELVTESLSDIIISLKKIIPLFGVVFVFMILNNMFFTPERIKKHFGSEAGVKGWLYSILFGVIMAGPPYVLYPMLKDMKKGGLRDAYLATFLYNRNVKLAFIPAMIYYFGLTYTIILSLLIVFFSVLNGLLVEKLIK